jgi:hypothetical protein
MHGLVATGAQRARAIRAVRRVIGVSSVAESIVVTSGSLARRLDEHLADDEVRLHAGFMCYDPGRAPELRLLLASHTRR